MPSRLEAECHLAALRGTLTHIHKRQFPHSSHIAWPPDLDRLLLRQLPLQRRTWNCIATAQLANGAGPITVGDLLSLKNFGQTSLRDFLFCLENFLQECARKDPSDAPPPASADNAAQNSVSGNQDESHVWDTIGGLLQPLLSAAAEFHGAETLADALDPRINRLADILGLSEQIEAVQLEDLLDGQHRLLSKTTRKAVRFYSALSEPERTIADHRILASPPKTLSRIGDFLDITRERVRQIQSRIEQQISADFGADLQIVALIAKDQLGHVIEESGVDEYLQALLPEETPGALLVRPMLMAKLEYAKQNGVYLDETALQALADIRAALPDCADDAGLVDEKKILETLPAEEEWRSLWPGLRKCCAFHNFFGSLALRDSAKAKTKAALLSIGRPAKKEEIAALSGISPQQTGAAMSNIPIIVRADKNRWGLADWISDKYDGIVGEILQRIDAGGGVAEISKILEEIPSKFDVNEASVRAYLQTPKFTVRNDYVTVADRPSITLKPLDDVIDGRNENDEPYWTFTAEVRHFKGFSLAGVPWEFAQAFGCAPEGMASIPVSDPAGCRNLSVRWNLAALSGATIGYLAQPLRLLEVPPGGRVRITIKETGAAELKSDFSQASNLKNEHKLSLIDS